MYAGELPGEEPQKTHIVVGRRLGGVEVPFGSVIGVEVLEIPLDAMLIFKEVSGNIWIYEQYL
jgi:hypothetical protein